MAVINEGMKKVIKGMAVTAQTAQFISLMPKPQDFVTRLVGDVVYLSVKAQKLSDDINKMLDQYADIPRNYIMTQVNSMTGSAANIVDKVNKYAQNGIEQTMDVPINALEIASSLTNTVTDTISATSKAVTSIGMTVAHTGSAVLGQEDVATDIHEASQEILKWTGDGFQSVKKTSTDPLKRAANTIASKKNGAKKKVGELASDIKEDIQKPQQFIERLLKELREKMDRLSYEIDRGFGSVTGVNSIANGANYVTEALKESENKAPANQVTLAVSQAVEHVLRNFSIAKVIRAFGGVLTQSAIVMVGLDKLPPIDFEMMLAKIRESNNKSNDQLYEELNAITNSAYGEMVDFGEKGVIKPSDNREYDTKKYKEFIKQYDEELSKQREEIRLSMKSRQHKKMTPYEEMMERRKLKSAIKEVNKFRKQVRKAKKSQRTKGVIRKELKNLKKETEFRSNSIKSDWNQMMKQYRKAISEIKIFFKNGGDGDKYINDCCNRINEDCDKIKAMCKALTTQLIACVIKTAVPADLGMTFPNPVYKIADFWMDVKTIFKFIKDLITLIIDIMNHVNKLARIMLNGINNLNEIIQQLMKILGLQWFMDLVQSIIDMFGGKITDARALLENMVSPVYYSDTEEYENTFEVLESIMGEDGDNATLTEDQYSYFANEVDRFHPITKKDLNKALKNEESFDEFLDELEKSGDDVVAYRSPILAPTENDQDNNKITVSRLMDGGEIDSDVKVIGWTFFHPKIDNDKYHFGKFLKKMKNRIIKKASKTGNKKRGGINMLKRKKVRKDNAYKAFYWYTYYTEDLEKDCFEYCTPQDAIKVDSVVQTENGSIVELTDGRKVFVANNMVRSGDYVTVEGVKYRVK